MGRNNHREEAKHHAIHRVGRQIMRRQDKTGKFQAIIDYYGELAFDFRTNKKIPEKVRKELIEISLSGKRLQREQAEVVAEAAMEWALEHGATHFCHWFQPLTGGTAEKHDSFLDFDKSGAPIQKLSGGQLMQGEPDASSFPNGGARSTFEARGYTSWDLTSPMFLVEGENGKTLCIPTAFVSYTGEALDIKTPLLRSLTRISEVGTRFLNLTGSKKSQYVSVTVGCEQEYFLIDKSLYYSRPDLVMTGRTLFGAPSPKNQQLDDHYFGAVPERVMSFMQELDQELYRLGIPAKTRHNEVAPAQFEIAPIFKDANVAADQNQLLMATIRSVANRHSFVAVLHEKPFAGINGSGKHVNWSMSDDKGLNLLEPGDNPESNHRFLAVVAMIVEAINRHGGALRMAISGHGNDHRLGANEAPPSIISIFLGDTLEKIYNSLLSGGSYSQAAERVLELGATQLANLAKDNTDRNRTSPFAFTGNKFEFRAVGSSQAVGFPISILNAAVSEVMAESCDILEQDIKGGRTVDEALLALTKKWMENSKRVVFNGDGYSEAWVKEAEERGLPNLRTTADALSVLIDEKKTQFLIEQKIFRLEELKTRYNVLVEKYNTSREIEFHTLVGLVHQRVLAAGVEYKDTLARLIANQKTKRLESRVEVELFKKLSFAMETLYSNTTNLKNAVDSLDHEESKRCQTIANELMPLSEQIAENCAVVEELVPDDVWTLPKYSDMLFVR